MSTLYQTYIAPILATNAAKYILPVGTMWALSNGIHQYIFKKAWEGNWWPDRRVQKGKSPQKEPTAQIQAIPRTVGALTLYGAAAMCWFAFHRFWMDVDSRPESLLDMGKKLFMTAVYCDLIYYSVSCFESFASALQILTEPYFAHAPFPLSQYHRIQHEVSPTLYKLFHKQHHQFFVVTPEASEWDDPKEVVVLLLTIDWLPSYLAKLDFGTYFVWRLINEIRHEHFHSGCAF